MTIFLILAPFAAFALLMLVTCAAISLFAGAAVAAAIIGYEVFRGRSIKMLAAGAVIMFSALGGYISLVDGDWSATEVRLAVDIGTLAIALASIAIRAPFTLQYAREAVDPETALKASSRKFRRRFRYIEDRLREQGRASVAERVEGAAR